MIRMMTVVITKLWTWYSDLMSRTRQFREGMSAVTAKDLLNSTRLGNILIDFDESEIRLISVAKQNQMEKIIRVIWISLVNAALVCRNKNKGKNASSNVHLQFYLYGLLNYRPKTPLSYIEFTHTMFIYCRLLRYWREEMADF